MRNVTDCIVMHHRFVISVILNHWHFISIYIYLYVYTVYGWMWLSLLHYTSCSNFFFFFLFVFIKQIFKTEFSFTLLCKAQKWKCIYSMLENWYIVINNKRVVCFTHTKVYCCLIPYVTRASGYKTTEVYYMIKLVMKSAYAAIGVIPVHIVINGYVISFQSREMTSQAILQSHCECIYWPRWHWLQNDFIFWPCTNFMSPKWIKNEFNIYVEIIWRKYYNWDSYAW